MPIDIDTVIKQDYCVQCGENDISKYQVYCSKCYDLLKSYEYSPKELPENLTAPQRDRLNRQLKDKLRIYSKIKEVDKLDFETFSKVHAIIFEFLIKNFTLNLDETTFSIGFKNGFRILIKSNKIHYIWYTLLGKSNSI